MSSTATLRLVTPRDIEILTALDRCPLTAAQLLKISETFALPFGTERRVRERLFQLCESGRLHRWIYSTAGQGAPTYYTLSLLGFRLLHGKEAVPPTKRVFEEVGVAKQHHTRSLADVIVHTAVCAHRAGVSFTGFYRENSLCLTIGEEQIFPDSAWQLIEPGGGEYGYFLEVDAGTERIRSLKDIENWERKIHFYDRFQDITPKRFRVVIVSTRSSERANHILDAAASIVRNPHRSLFYGLALPQYVAESHALTVPIFRDHRGHAAALLPSQRQFDRVENSTDRRLAVP